MGSKDPYFTVAAVGAQLWTATVLVPWQWPKWFGYKFSCWHAWEGMFCKYEVTYCSMKLLKSVFLKNLVMKNIANKVHKLHLAYLTKQISAHSNLSYLWLWRTQRNWQDAGHYWVASCLVQEWKTVLGLFKRRSTLCFHKFFALFKKPFVLFGMKQWVQQLDVQKNAPFYSLLILLADNFKHFLWLCYKKFWFFSCIHLPCITYGSAASWAALLQAFSI